MRLSPWYGTSLAERYEISQRIGGHVQKEEIKVLPKCQAISSVPTALSQSENEPKWVSNDRTIVFKWIKEEEIE